MKKPQEHDEDSNQQMQILTSLPFEYHRTLIDSSECACLWHELGVYNDVDKDSIKWDKG